MNKQRRMGNTIYELTFWLANGVFKEKGWNGQDTQAGEKDVHASSQRTGNLDD